MATKTPASTEVKTENRADTTVDEVVSDWSKSWEYTSGAYHQKWQNMSDLYDSKRVWVGYNGISDTFVPMSYSTVETMVAATAGEKPVVEYIPTKPSQQANTDVLNGLFSFYWDIDGWTNKTIPYTRNLFKLGTGVAMLYWDIDHPCKTIIPLRDFFCDPGATILNYQNAKFMGYRFLASKSVLEKEQIVDPVKGELVKKYKNLDKLGKSDPGDLTDKQTKDTSMGSTIKADDDQIEVICHWTLDKVTYVANRQMVIYQTDNYFKQRQQFLGWENPKGMYPFIIDSFLGDESLLYGRSVLDAIAKPQELLNDMTNQNIDAVSWAMDPVMELDPQYASYIDKIKNVTGAVYPFKPGSYQAVNKPQIPSNAFNERTNIKNEIRETTAVDEIIKGIGTPSRTTATEVKAQVASAGRRFDIIIWQLENGYYYTLAKLVFQMVQMYVTQPTAFRVLGKEGIQWQQFDPKMFKGDYEPRVKLQATINNEKSKKMRDLKELYTSMLGNPTVDQSEMTKLVIGKAFDLKPEEVDKLIVPPEKISPPEPKEDKTAEQIALEGVAKKYDKLAPDVKAQIEQMAGLQESATHDGGMERAAAEDFAAINQNDPTTLNLDQAAGLQPVAQEAQLAQEAPVEEPQEAIIG